MELKMDNNGYTLAVEWLKLNVNTEYARHLILNNDGFTLVDIVNQKIKNK